MNTAKKGILIIDNEEDCGYLPQNRTRMGYLLPRHITSSAFLDREEYLSHKFSLLSKGFLSEAFAAAANLCPSCNLCVPVRINLSKVEETRNQRTIRTKAGKSLESFRTEGKGLPVLTKFYKDYMNARHPSSKMAGYSDTHISNIFYSFTDMMVTYATANKRIKAIGLFDHYGDAATMDMVMYDTSDQTSGISLGYLSWLEIQNYVANQGAKYLYIGAISKSPKLAYKATRNPEALEAYIDGDWVSYDPEKHTKGPDYRSNLSSMGHNLA